MFGHDDKEEDVRNIYQRACMLYVPIGRPGIRLQYAMFEEMCGRYAVAEDVYKGVLLALPGCVEVILSWADMQRRMGGLDAAIKVLKEQIDSRETDIYAKGHLVAEWARMLWKTKGSPDEARQVYQKNHHWYLDSRAFWISYLHFELEQPTSAETESTQHARIKQVYDDIRRKAHLPLMAVIDMTNIYLNYLQRRGGKDSAKEWMAVDREVKG